MKIGILFGGPSREREISFAGGRTVYDNLDKTLFEPVPIFIDSVGNFILLNWEYLYKGTIRDFYPPVEFLPESINQFQVYVESIGEIPESLFQKVGRKITLNELPALIDFAFLTLHGAMGEDGQIQGLLDLLKIPYTGSGIRASSIGMDKAFQKKMLKNSGFKVKPFHVIKRNEWQKGVSDAFFYEVINELKWPVVIRPANQGSSIGVTIVREDQGLQTLKRAIEKAFFIADLDPKVWKNKTSEEKLGFVRSLTDIRDSLGFPIVLNGQIILHPENLLKELDKASTHSDEKLILESQYSENDVVLEGFISGREFSCIVVRNDDGNPVALPPTEIVKGGEVYDYRSKYLPGLSRKLTPIDLPNQLIEDIRNECEKLYNFFEFQTYARIDGFINEEGEIFLNDPNTTSGMLPSSFFFHQAAEIGLNPSEFLTYIIRTSIIERTETSALPHNHKHLLKRLDNEMDELKTKSTKKLRVAVFLGGYSFERHISVESGRNIYEKLSSSSKYSAFPVFVDKDGPNHKLYEIPINLLLKDNADDISDKIHHFKKHEIVETIKRECKSITERFSNSGALFEPKEISYQELSEKVDCVFIALHGRPGEDGTVQAILEKYKIPYNGSGPESSKLTINKYDTLQKLRNAGFTTTGQTVYQKPESSDNYQTCFDEISSQFGIPFLVKPVDDGCSSAVMIIKDFKKFSAYCNAIFRPTETLSNMMREDLGLSWNEEFPAKDNILIEELILSNGAENFLEITGGLLTSLTAEGLKYEIFEPSEALASGEILSLEEKFLAGEGQNITPARFATPNVNYETISNQVRNDLEKTAKILGVEGYARIDAFVRINGKEAQTIIIEVNSLPGMTPATCIFHQCAINGYKPYDFIDKILTYGIEAKKNKLS